VTVAGGLQRFIFPCPYCGTQLIGSFYAEQPTEPFDVGDPHKPFEIKSEDFELLDYDAGRETPDMLAVAINTELPVHVSLLSAPVTEHSLTPFLRLMQLSGHSDQAVEVVERVNVLRQMRFEMLPPVRRAAAFYGRGDMRKLGRELQRIPIISELDLKAADPWAALGVLLQAFLRTIGADAPRRAARDELGQLVRAAADRDSGATRGLVAEFNRRILGEHRRSLLDTLVRSLEVNDALVPGLWLEAIPDLDLDVYRIQRADFDDVKTRYQEIFELGSRTIVLPASLANIARRRDAREYCDGVRHSLRDALRAGAQVREGWLDELPAAKALYDDTARKTRNLIGHRLVSYDYERAALIDDSGTPHNYLLFLRDYLGAVRSCCYLLDVVELLTTFEHRSARSEEVR
jgi:hypothetical protein